MMEQAKGISAQLIRTAFESEHFPGLFTGRGTHSKALQYVAQLVKHTQDTELITSLVKSGLPTDYNGNTIREIPGMVRDAIDKGFATENGKTPKTVSAAASILEVLEDAGWTYFHDSMGRPYGSRPTKSGGHKIVRLNSHSGELQIKHDVYSATGRPPTPTSFKAAQDAVIARALFDSDERPVFLRLARFGEQAIYNLADANQQTVAVSKTGVTVSTASPVAFLASPAMLPVPVPQDPGSRDVLNEFQELLGLEDRLFARVLAFIIAAFKPEGPYLILMVQGEQGSGKSFLSYVLKTLIDPSVVPKIRLPSNERDLMIQAQDNHLLVYDNISGLSPDMSDVLCVLSTGGGFATRRLYANDELQIFMNCRPVILNGINPATTRPDLLDRSLSLTLPIMGVDQRREESDMIKVFEKLRPFLMHEIFRIISVALDQYDQVEAPKHLRMIDAGRWLRAAETALPDFEGVLIASLQESQNEAVLESVLNNSLTTALQKLVARQPFEGRMVELFNRLEQPPSDRRFPKTPAHLSGALNRMRKSLLLAGVKVEFSDRDRMGRTVKVSLIGEVNTDRIFSIGM